MGKIRKEPIPKTYNELLAEYKKIKSIVTDDTLFMAKALLFIAKQLSKKRKRKLSDYNIFLREKLKQGMTLKQAVEEWRKHKRKT